MRMRMRTTGIKDLIVELRHAGERTSQTGRKTMHKVSDKIVEEARLNAPVDKHNLERSIRKETAYGDRNRLEITIVAGGFINGVNVDEYAAEVHENYESMGVGPGTAAKRAANPGRYVGEKFLERAAEAYERRLEADMIEAITKVFN